MKVIGQLSAIALLTLREAIRRKIFLVLILFAIALYIYGSKEAGKKGVSIQRYKGLGEMNPDQLWETTLDPEKRTLLKVGIEEETDIENTFVDLMGEKVEKRREYIQANAKKVVNLDI